MNRPSRAHARRPSHRRAHRAALAASVVAALAAALGCDGGEADGACVALVGAYDVALGPGTGDCDPATLEADDLIRSVVVPDDAGCGARTLASAGRDGRGGPSDGCTTAAVLAGTVGDDGVRDAVLRVESSCTADGATCRHSFRATLTPAPDAAR